MVVREAVVSEFEVVGYGFEEEAKNAVGEFGLLLATLNKSVNDVHLKIE